MLEIKKLSINAARWLVDHSCSKGKMVDTLDNGTLMIHSNRFMIVHYGFEAIHHQHVYA